MYLELHPNGGKYWRMNYQFQKKEKTLALGVWPQTSLVEARHKRDEAKMLLKSGKDPNLEKKKLKSNAVWTKGTHSVLSVKNGLKECSMNGLKTTSMTVSGHLSYMSCLI